MKISVIDWGILPGEASELAHQIAKLFAETRFVVPDISTKQCGPRSKYKAEVSFGLVKLAKSKLYCGNHPSACELGNKDDKKSKHLEGADWVEFDDRLNDLLDTYCISADVGASVIIRKGKKRCIEYRNGAKPLFGNYQWAKHGEYDDYCGRKAPRSHFPEGTPGRHDQKHYSLVG